MTKKKYMLIDQTQIPSCIYQNSDFYIVCHEYLSIIERDFDTLLRFNVKSNNLQSRFSHLFIVEVYNSDDQKKYLMENCRFKLDFNSFHMVLFNNSKLPSMKGCNSNRIIAEYIKQKVQEKYNRLVSSKNKVSNQKSTTNNTKDVLKSTNKFVNSIKNKRIDMGKRLIPTMSDSEEDIAENKDTYNQCDVNELKLPRPFSTIIDSNSKEDMSIPDNVNISDIEDVDPENLKKHIKQLEELKKQEQEKLDNMKDKLEEDIDNFSKYFDNLNDKKRFLRKDKDKEKERKRIFESDKRTYSLIKTDILDGKLDKNNVPTLFTSKYPIFEFMDDNNLLDTDDDYLTYLKLYNDLYPEEANPTNGNNYVPHNINYLSPKEKEKYAEIGDKYKNQIEEFIKNGNSDKKKYPPLDEILADLDSKENSESDIESDSEGIPELVNFEVVENVKSEDEVVENVKSEDEVNENNDEKN